MAKFLWYLIVEVLIGCCLHTDSLQQSRANNINLSGYCKIMLDNDLIARIQHRNGSQIIGEVHSDSVLIAFFLQTLNSCKETKFLPVDNRSFIEIVHTDGSAIRLFYSKLNSGLLFNNKYYTCEIPTILSIFKI